MLPVILLSLSLFSGNNTADGRQLPDMGMTGVIAPSATAMDDCCGNPPPEPPVVAPVTFADGSCCGNPPPEPPVIAPVEVADGSCCGNPPPEPPVA